MDLNLGGTPQQLTAFGAMVWAWTVEFLPRIGAALAVLIVGAIVATWVSRAIGAALRRAPQIDYTVVPVAGAVVRYAILILVVVAALGQLGVQTTSLLAVLGAAGLAIGLALQGTLANIAAGIMLLYLRPFRAGDTIETPLVIGKVKEIGLFATSMETLDGLYYFVPNSALWNVPLKNQTRNPRRLVTVTLNVSYEADLAEAKRVLADIAKEEPRVLSDPEPTVSVESYMDNRVVIALRAWVATADFPDVQRRLAEAAKTRLQAAGIKMPI